MSCIYYKFRLNLSVRAEVRFPIDAWVVNVSPQALSGVPYVFVNNLILIFIHREIKGNSRQDIDLIANSVKIEFCTFLFLS